MRRRGRPRPVVEAFADRAYLRDGRLVPRSEPDALVLDPQRGRGACRPAGHRARGGLRRRLRGRRGRPVDLPARRHARRRRARPRRARRARRRRGRASRRSPREGAAVRPARLAGRDRARDASSATLRAIEQRQHPDVAELVPAACTVLVRLRDGAPTELGGWLAGVESRRCGRVTTEPTTRSGSPSATTARTSPAVADACGLAVDEVVARHAGRTYVCAFCGFAPGFAYLRGLDPDAPPAPSGHAANPRPGRLGRHRRRVQRGVSQRVARWLAPARPHGRQPVGSGPGPAGADRPRRRRSGSSRCDRVVGPRAGLGDDDPGRRASRVRRPRACRPRVRSTSR